MTNTEGLSLFKYAAQNWARHLSQAGSDRNFNISKIAAEKLFDITQHVFKLWVQGERDGGHQPYFLPYQAPGLLWAAYFGLTSVVELLLESQGDVNVPDMLGRTALFFASNAGHADTVRILLSKGAQVDAKEVLAQTALTLALRRQHLEISNMLQSSSTANSDPQDFERVAPISDQTEITAQVSAVILGSANGVEACLKRLRRNLD